MQPDRTARTVDPIHHQLLVAFSHSNRAMLARTRRTGLKPGQPKVLEHVVAHEGCSQRDIARACVMDQSTVTSVVTRMETEGLIMRRSRPGDRRGLEVHLTEAGRAAAAQVLACRDEVDAIAWRGFSDAERAELSELLGRVVRNLEDAEEKGR